MGKQLFRFVTLGALVFGAFRATAGCSESSPQTGPVASVIANETSPAASANARKVGEFVAHMDHATHQFVIEKVGRPGALGGAGIHPESVDGIPDNQYVLDDGGGAPVAETVDLVTTNTNDRYPGHNAFNATVELRSFFSRELTNVYVQITSVTFGGNPISGYDATNSVTTNPLGLDATHGLWSYVGKNVPADAGSYIPANPGAPQSPNTNNGNFTSTQTWMFNNTSDQNIVYGIAVWASKGFSTYTQGFANTGYLDVCTGGHMPDAGAPAKKNISLPFDFTIYGANVSQVNMDVNGQLTFGSDTGASKLTSSGTPLALPSASAPGPSFFPFWDDLTFGVGGEMCWQTFGHEPNQMAGFEWRNVTFASGVDQGAVLDFEVILFEGTGEIDTIYRTMTPAAGDTSGRETGNQAWVGMQDATRTIATGEFQAANYGAGQGWSYLPTP